MLLLCRYCRTYRRLHKLQLRHNRPRTTFCPFVRLDEPRTTGKLQDPQSTSLIPVTGRPINELMWLHQNESSHPPRSEQDLQWHPRFGTTTSRCHVTIQMLDLVVVSSPFLLSSEDWHSSRPSPNGSTHGTSSLDDMRRALSFPRTRPSSQESPEGKAASLSITLLSVELDTTSGCRSK